MQKDKLSNAFILHVVMPVFLRRYISFWPNDREFIEVAYLRNATSSLLLWLTTGCWSGILQLAHYLLIPSVRAGRSRDHDKKYCQELAHSCGKCFFFFFQATKRVVRIKSAPSSSGAGATEKAEKKVERSHQEERKSSHPV